jgi:hypothetical protein
MSTTAVALVSSSLPRLPPARQRFGDPDPGETRRSVVVASRTHRLRMSRSRTLVIVSPT